MPPLLYEGPKSLRPNDSASVAEGVSNSPATFEKFDTLIAVEPTADSDRDVNASRRSDEEIKSNDETLDESKVTAVDDHHQQQSMVKRKFSTFCTDNGDLVPSVRQKTTQYHMTSTFTQLSLKETETSSVTTQSGTKRVTESWTVEHKVLVRTAHPPAKGRSFLDRVEVATMWTFPRSTYNGFKDPLPTRQDIELSVLRKLMEKEQVSEDPLDTFTSYKLEDFRIYRDQPGKRYNGELCALNVSGLQLDELVLDGILNDGTSDSRHYVQGVPLKVYSIGNYLDKNIHGVANAVWVQSLLGHKHDVWYELGSPSKEYSRYHQPFLWLCGLAKHVLDYVKENSSEGGKPIVLENFRSDFYTWLQSNHGNSEEFQRWFREYKNKDFRQAISAHSRFLWNQAYLIDQKYCDTFFFREVHLLDVVEPSITNSPSPQRTVVTPYVYKCFEHIFGPYMVAVSAPQLKQEETASETSDKASFPRVVPEIVIPVSRPDVTNIKVGDVISVLKDASTPWKGQNNRWLAYVTAIHTEGSQQFYEVIWCYRPEDTLCAGMKYPCEDELFFSDHCNHGCPLIPHEEVLEKVSVSFFEQSPYARYFVRTKYQSADSSFVTLTQADFRTCSCDNESDFELAKKKYKLRDAILVESSYAGKKLLEPVVIEAFDDQNERILVRELFRRSRMVRRGHPNELVWTECISSIEARRVVRKCHVRFVLEQDLLDNTLPELYDQDGSFDLFFVLSRENIHGNLEYFKSREEFPELNIGIDISVPPCAPLRGLDLFCGGGSLGRGTEEGGHVVKNVCAVDINVSAMHTYRANINPKHADDVQLYLGSVNDFLRNVIEGTSKEGIPKPDDIDFIVAGSPCQGFSTANSFKNNDKSMRNSSLVASVASFVETYKPKYALLENVLGLATTRKHPTTGEDYNVYSQLLCVLVGMGYQVRQFTMDAWSHGSAQSRTRMFIVIAAPSLKLPEKPPTTHAHPDNMRSQHIARAPNGILICPRDFATCPLPCRTSKDIMDDLPRIGDGHPRFSCVQYPDHTMSRSNNSFQRAAITYIPRITRGTYSNACASGRMPNGLKGMSSRKKELSNSAHNKAWGRINENGLCRTITTTCQPECIFTGTWLHYSEPRLLTVQEARRVQSIPDKEVLVAQNPAEALRIVGNGVDRRVARALGLALRVALES